MKNLFRKVALYSLISVIILIFVGATVRVTGSGMGCPDWPKCWGKYIPPTSKEQINIKELNQERFEKKWKQHRGDEPFPGEDIINEFNPTHTWIEYFNRLTSIPVGIFTLATMILSFQYRQSKPSLFWGSLSALILVGVNAWMGAMIVYTGLKPGIITLHMALAILLLCVQTYLIIYSNEKEPGISFKNNKANTVISLAILSFLLIITEGILGSQVRETTDVLQKSHPDTPRIEWVAELEQTTSYIIHRSFSWAILIGILYWFFTAKTYQKKGLTWLEYLVLAMVLSQLLLGLTLAHIGVIPFAQALHIGLSAILVCALFAWICKALKNNSSQLINQLTHQKN